jgi:glyoxylase-like metal-dependent hydrolase (beta-lactamase superfamily II)
MLRVERHGDVTRIELTSPRSRLVGYSVSAYVSDGVLVDTGFPAVRADVARLLVELRPRGVVVTHEHEDHAGNVELVAGRGLPLAASTATIAAVREVGAIGFYRRFTWGTMPALHSTVLPFDPAPLALLPAPGHSADHHVVWDAERETLFGGDLFLGVKVRIAHHGEDPRLLARSVRMAADLRPRRLFDAHRGLVEHPAAALRAKADWLDETIGRIDRRIAEGWSDRAIRQDVLGREEPTGYFSLGEYSRLTFVKAVRGIA